MTNPDLFIETERLIIREIRPTDEQGVFELDADPFVHEYLGARPFTDIKQSRDLIAQIRQQYDEYGIGRWAVVAKNDGAFLGWTGFKWITDTINGHQDYYDFGYRFCRKYWGQGFATEAGKAAMQYGLTHLRLKPIYAMTHPGNLASRKVLEKVGMHYTGDFPFDNAAFSYWRKPGEPVSWFELGDDLQY